MNFVPLTSDFSGKDRCQSVSLHKYYIGMFDLTMCSLPACISIWRLRGNSTPTPA
jgi:hypothetical protein